MNTMWPQQWSIDLQWGYWSGVTGSRLFLLLSETIKENFGSRRLDLLGGRHAWWGNVAVASIASLKVKEACWVILRLRPQLPYSEIGWYSWVRWEWDWALCHGRVGRWPSNSQQRRNLEEKEGNVLTAGCKSSWCATTYFHHYWWMFVDGIYIIVQLFSHS